MDLKSFFAALVPVFFAAACGSSDDQSGTAEEDIRVESGKTPEGCASTNSEMTSIAVALGGRAPGSSVRCSAIDAVSVTVDIAEGKEVPVRFTVDTTGRAGADLTVARAGCTDVVEHSGSYEHGAWVDVLVGMAARQHTDCRTPMTFAGCSSSTTNMNELAAGLYAKVQNTGVRCTRLDVASVAIELSREERPSTSFSAAMGGREGAILEVSRAGCTSVRENAGSYRWDVWVAAWSELLGRLESSCQN